MVGSGDHLRRSRRGLFVSLGFSRKLGRVNMLQIAGRSTPSGIADRRFQISEVIATDTRTVLVDQPLVKRIGSRDRTQFPSCKLTGSESPIQHLRRRTESATGHLSCSPGRFRASDSHFTCSL